MAARTRYKKNIYWVKYPPASWENTEAGYYPFHLRVYRADILCKTGCWNEAEAQCFQNLSAARRSGSSAAIAESANQLGFLLMQRGKYQEALPLYRESLDISNRAGLGKQACNTTGNLGNLYRNMGDYQKAGMYFDQALELAAGLGDRYSMSIIRGNMGLMFWYMGEHRKAMDCSDLKMKIDVEDDNLQLICTGYANLGSIHFSMGNYVLAEECYNKQIAIARKIGDKYSLRVALNNLAGIYDNREDYSKALECYCQSLEIAREMGNKSGERVVTNNMGMLFSYRGDFDQALELAEKSLKLACQMGDRRGEGIVNYTIGTIHKDHQQYALSQGIFLAAKSIFEELSVKEYLCECLSNLSQVMLELKEITQAREYSRQARQLAELLNRKEYLAGLDIIDAEIGLASGAVAPEEYEVLVEPQVANASAKIQAEMFFRLYQVTGKSKYGKAAREVILSRPNWQFRLDYRKWMKILNAGVSDIPLK